MSRFIENSSDSFLGDMSIKSSLCPYIKATTVLFKTARLSFRATSVSKSLGFLLRPDLRINLSIDCQAALKASSCYTKNLFREHSVSTVL